MNMVTSYSNYLPLLLLVSGYQFVTNFWLSLLI
ncbi:LOW QUALITY PROTEIN: hypothetical protein PanWU01x14_178140 [Parasponia andersonii]|uniref:Uncharacterized protein n=1 Tax=Parasponia andersonii TaxID=3476 RepID=A0A2P5C7C8_PARAD|nr:LOW QUALITY PROTEIN: hypothetical protein PanWU01x14_178140 [Parasponia andersonii]